MAKKTKSIPVDRYGKHAAGVPKAKASVNVPAYVARQQDKRNRGR